MTVRGCSLRVAHHRVAELVPLTLIPPLLAPLRAQTPSRVASLERWNLGSRGTACARESTWESRRSSALDLAVPDTGTDAKTADELMASTDLKKTTVREALARMVKEGKLLQTGTGRKGAPYRYWRLATS